jgi:hypothetical protein
MDIDELFTPVTAFSMVLCPEFHLRVFRVLMLVVYAAWVRAGGW